MTLHIRHPGYLVGAGVVGMLGFWGMIVAGSTGNPPWFDLTFGGLMLWWGVWLLQRRHAVLKTENAGFAVRPALKGEWREPSTWVALVLFLITFPFSFFFLWAMGAYRPAKAEVRFHPKQAVDTEWKEVPQAAPKPRASFVGGSQYCPKCDTVLYLSDACSCGWKRAQIPSERPGSSRSVVTPERDAAAFSVTPRVQQSEITESSINGVVQTSGRPDADSQFNRNRIHLATDGTHVRSKSELVIINLLHARRIQYEYEGVLERNGEIRRPDFTVRTARRTYYWEHLGMLSDPGYANDWAAKQAWYASNGITTTSEGERLVITKDRPDGSLDSSELERTISALE